MPCGLVLPPWETATLPISVFVPGSTVEYSQAKLKNRNITHTISPIDVPYASKAEYTKSSGTLFCLWTVGAPCSKLPSKGTTVSFRSAYGKQC